MGFTCIFGYQSRDNLRRDFTVAKWTYCILFALVAMITWLLRDFSSDWFATNVSAFTYCGDPQYAAMCTGKQVAVRMSFANFCFFALHMLVLLCVKSPEDPRIGLHTSVWFWKILLWAGTIVGFFFVPTDAIVVYGQIARFGSGIFLVFQLVELVNFLYELNEKLVAADSRFSWAVLIVGAVTTYSLSLAMIGIGYHWFAPSSSCSLNIFFLTWTLIMGLAGVGVLFLPHRVESASLMTSGGIFCYCSFLTLSAMNSEPTPSACILGMGAGDRWLQVVAVCLALAAVAYSTANTGSANLFKVGGSEENEDELPYRLDFFHVIYALASMYIAMLLTSWEISVDSDKYELDQGWISTWVKMGSKWACELLYLWTVIAPACLSGRDFS